MAQIIIGDQAKAFLECQSPPVCARDVAECFSGQSDARWHPTAVQSFIGKTASGRFLRISFRLCWTGEIEVLKVIEPMDDDSLVDPEQELQIAEHYPADAVMLKESIRRLPPENREHLEAEAAFTQVLGQANAHLCAAFSRFADQSMKDHVLIKIEHLNEVEKAHCSVCKNES